LKYLPLGFRIAIYSLAILIIILVYYFAFYSPKVKIIKQKQGQYNQIYNEIINLSPKVTDDKYWVSLEELKLAKALWKKLKGYLPSSDEMANPNILYDELVNLSERKGVNLKIYETGKKNITKIDKFQSKISFDIILDGEFMSVVSFFYSLNNLKNLINAEEFSVDPVRDKTDSTRLVLKGTFSVFKFEME
jgi:Tfp pilus assembly protein PilO